MPRPLPGETAWTKKKENPLPLNSRQRDSSAGAGDASKPAKKRRKKKGHALCLREPLLRDMPCFEGGFGLEMSLVL